jgi:hypothetical protein
MTAGLATIEEDPDRDFESFVTGEGSTVKKDDLKRAASIEGPTLAMYQRPSVSANRIVPLLSIRTARSNFQLAGPIAVNLYAFQGLFVAENETLGIISHGTTQPEALAEFRSTFEVLYEEIAEADPDVLAEDAKHLRDILRELVVTSSR